MQPPALPDERQQVMDPITAYQTVSILEGVVQRGTGTIIRAVGKPLAAKTGTTNDQADAWTMGFSPDLVVGVWVGFDARATWARARAAAVPRRSSATSCSRP